MIEYSDIKSARRELRSAACEMARLKTLACVPSNLWDGAQERYDTALARWRFLRGVTAD